MNPDMLLRHFDEISEAPDAIPRLRRFILDLAVRGKLIPQDPNDEPASELLKRIKKERECLAKQDIIRKQEPLLSIEIESIPFDLPKHWKWIRLGEVIKLWNGFAFSSSTYRQQGIPVIRIGDLQNGSVVLDSVVRVDNDVASFVDASIWIPENALLIAMSGATTGKVAFNRTGQRLLLNQRVGRVQTFLLNDNFLKFFFETIIQENLSISFGTAIPNLSTKQIIETIFPLPPLAEQYRIVAKVDQLMGLCDELEEGQARREKRRDRLVAATLHGMNNGTNGEDFHDTARFYFNHFPRLSIRPEHIHQLRQTILNLAVHGKLVPQDPNDEPVSELLKRIGKEKERITANDRIKEQVRFQVILPDEIPFAIPNRWTWVRLSEISVVSGGMTPSKNRSDFWDGDINWFSPKDIKSDELFDSELKITSTALNESGIQFYPPGCLFIVARSGILKRTIPVSINRIPAAVNQDMKVLNLHVKDMARYLQIMFRGMCDFILTKLVKTGTTVQSLKYSEFENQLFPLPPLAEQHRIVAKVDELMAICDELEAQLINTSTTRRQLLESTLKEVLFPQDQP
jgi:type I restriction enzyme S subunit